jgi:molybdopterin synthase catalytic subunit
MALGRFAVTPAPLSLDDLTATVLAAASGPVGAVTGFTGLVRGRNLDRDVLFLEYEAYEALALKAFSRIDEEARQAWSSTIVGAHHRIGRLEVGDASIVIAAASAHRADAFAACRYVIERVKQIVPIWKHEHFAGGEVWIEGATADPDDGAAREEARRRACA